MLADTVLNLYVPPRKCLENNKLDLPTVEERGYQPVSLFNEFSASKAVSKKRFEIGGVDPEQLLLSSKGISVSLLLFVVA